MYSDTIKWKVLTLTIWAFQKWSNPKGAGSLIFNNGIWVTPKATVTHGRFYSWMPMVEHCFIFVAILGKKSWYIYCFLWWVEGDNGYWGLSTYTAANFQWLHNEFGRVDYVNLMNDQGLFKKHKEMPKRVNDARRITGDCSIVHPYYYHKHDTWSQMNSNLHRATDGQGSLVECATTIPFHKNIYIGDHGEGFKHFKTVGTLQGACMTLQVDAECLYGLSTLPQINYHRDFPDFYFHRQSGY